MLVLGLLGMILYGAYVMVQKGKSGAKLEDAPSFAAPEGASTPAVTMPPPVAFGGPPKASAEAPVASQPEPTVLSAISAPPPAVGDVPSQTTPITPPPALPAFGSAVAAPAAAAIAPLAAAGGAASSPAVTLPTVDVGGTLGDGPPSSTAGGSFPMPPPVAAPARGQTSAFAAAWADAHDKLAAGRYAEALAVLSAWYDDPTLGLEEGQRLEELLGQLAGTVIYSQQDLVLPPHIAAPGETLQSIAATAGVPWQLLAKINGVDDPASLLPGEALKMIRGPFDAVVSLSRRRLSLQLGGNYAGSFPVVIGRRVQEQVGASLPVADVQRAAAAGPVAVPVAFAPQGAGGRSAIVLANGLRIEAADDPAAVADAAPESTLVVSARDLAELVDILGRGSNVLIRQ
jgi:hypothetical protein